MEDKVTVYERKLHIAVDPANGEDKCVKVWYYKDKDDNIQILKYEDYVPEVVYLDQRR